LKKLTILFITFLILGTAALTAEEPQIESTDDNSNITVKLTESNKKIEKAVVAGYKAVENAFVIGYKAVEDGVVKGFKKIEKAFIDAFTTPNVQSEAHNGEDDD